VPVSSKAKAGLVVACHDLVEVGPAQWETVVGKRAEQGGVHHDPAARLQRDADSLRGVTQVPRQSLKRIEPNSF
jgi:hypothetical protein